MVTDTPGPHSVLRPSTVLPPRNGGRSVSRPRIKVQKDFYDILPIRLHWQSFIHVHILTRLLRWPRIVELAGIGDSAGQARLYITFLSVYKRIYFSFLD